MTSDALDSHTRRAPNPEELARAKAGDETAFRRVVEPHRDELRAHCYRMSGSLADADELVQESLLRAWRGLSSFEERASLRTWLFRITTHVCLDELEKRPTRALPIDLGAASLDGVTLPPTSEPIWIEPCPSPLASTSSRERVAFAFLSALQRLPPRQRAALILKDVLGYDAAECAELLEMTVPAINSALQRARATLDKPQPEPTFVGIDEVDDTTRALLAKYLDAWERADVDALVTLLRDDAILQMPPFPSWLQGASAIAASLRDMVLTPESKGRFKLVATSANGLPAFAMYDLVEQKPASIHVLGLVRDASSTGAGAVRVASITAFLDPSLFARFDLPAGT